MTFFHCSFYTAGPIARSVSIAFDVSLKDLSETEPLPRSYPKAPAGQKRRYYPAGSTASKFSP